MQLESITAWTFCGICSAGLAAMLGRTQTDVNPTDIAKAMRNNIRNSFPLKRWAEWQKILEGKGGFYSRRNDLNSLHQVSFVAQSLNGLQKLRFLRLLCIRPHGVSFAVAFFWELRSWCRPDRANAAIAGTSDASRNVVDSVISATPWRRLRCSGTNCVLGPAYNETRAHHTRTYPSRRHHNTPPGHTAITGLTPANAHRSPLRCRQLGDRANEPQGDSPGFERNQTVNNRGYRPSAQRFPTNKPPALACLAGCLLIVLIWVDTDA